jgi:hypothetical protein
VEVHRSFDGVPGYVNRLEVNEPGVNLSERISVNIETPTRTVPTAVSMFSLWLVPIIIADFTLLPMFHIGGLPWKPGYLLMIVGVLIYAQKMPSYLLLRTRPIFIVALILAGSAAIGSIIFEIQTSYGASTATLRALIIYALGPLAFLVGVGDRRSNHRYLLLVIIVFATLNIVHGIFAADWHWLAHFYNTGGLTDGGLYDRGVRLPGIMNNPNITALTAVILLMFVTTGFRWGHNRPSVRTAVVSILLTGFIVVIMLSRNQMLALFIVGFATLLYLPNRMGRQTFVASAVIIAIVLAGLLMMSSDRQERTFGIRLTESFQNRLASSGISSSGLDNSLLGHDGLTRPLHGFTHALRRFNLSPIFGTGYEESDQVPAPDYHNDWVTMVVAGGLIGFGAYVFLAVLLVRIEPLLAVPLILPGLTNALLPAPQHFLLLMLLAGLIAGQRWRKQRGEGRYAFSS